MKDWKDSCINNSVLIAVNKSQADHLNKSCMSTEHRDPIPGSGMKTKQEKSSKWWVKGVA